jgi:hypothetical protein
MMKKIIISAGGGSSSSKGGCGKCHINNNFFFFFDWDEFVNMSKASEFNIFMNPMKKKCHHNGETNTQQIFRKDLLKSFVIYF